MVGDISGSVFGRVFWGNQTAEAFPSVNSGGVTASGAGGSFAHHATMSSQKLRKGNRFHLG
jgi:hypothetical protein